MPRLRLEGLWRNPDFLRLWAGQSISQVGSQVSLIALPLAAVALGAGAAQMGFLAAARSAPVLVMGLLAGAWVDRVRRRPVLIAADAGHAILLACIPVGAWLGLLRLEVLYVVACGVGVLSVLFNVAYQAYLPSLVRRDDLVDGNSKLATTARLADVVGPTLGGGLVQAVSAAVAIAADALSFAVSALFLCAIRAPEVASEVRAPRRAIWSEIGEGLRVVAGDAVLRSIAGATGLFELFDGLIFSVYVLYVTRDLGIVPAALGLVFGVGSVGGLAGALVAARVSARVGMCPTLASTLVLAALGDLLIPLAGGPPVVAAAMLAAAEVIVRFAATIFGIDGTSLTQAITPGHLRGRVNATMRVISGGLSPVGALAGGALGEAVGLHATVLVGALGVLSATIWLFLSRIASVRSVPAELPTGPAR